MSDKFSFLEKDKKTYNHVKMYFDAINNGASLNSVDILIQKQELECHLKKTCKEHDRIEETAWVMKNAAPFRCYLNSLKTVTLFAFLNSKIHLDDDISFTLFCRMVDIFNEEKSLIIESIRIEH